MVSWRTLARCRPKCTESHRSHSRRSHADQSFRHLGAEPGLIVISALGLRLELVESPVIGQRRQGKQEQDQDGSGFSH